LGVCQTAATVTKKVVVMFVRFRAPLHLLHQIPDLFCTHNKAIEISEFREVYGIIATLN
jgi:hypothetical protein